MRLVGQLVIDQLARVGADLLAPVEQALRRSLTMGLVRGGHVFALGAVGPATAQQHMAGHPSVAMQHFQGMRRQPHLDALPGQGGGHAVEAAIDLDAVVDADLAALEGGNLVGMYRQRSQGRAIQALEPVASAAVEALERAPIQILHQLGDDLVKRMQAEELPLAQPRHDPAFDHLHRHLGRQDPRRRCAGAALPRAEGRARHAGNARADVCAGWQGAGRERRPDHIQSFFRGHLGHGCRARHTGGLRRRADRAGK